MSHSSPSSIPIVRALQDASGMQSLQQRMRESSRRLATIQPVLPPILRPHVFAGPWEADNWCLLTSNHAAATKVRQLVPLMVARLEAANLPVTKIRIKVRQAT